MEICALLAGIDWHVGVPTWITATGTLALAAAAFCQFRSIGKNQSAWATIEACNKYDLDPVLRQKIEALIKWYKSSDGDSEERREAAQANAEVLFNYFEGLALGYFSNHYDHDLLRGHLGGIIIEWVDDLFFDLGEKAIWRNNEEMKKSFSNTIKLAREIRCKV